MRYATSLDKGRLLAAIAGLILVFAVPAAAQYNIYDLGQAVATQDIQADNTNTVHLVWTSAGVIYYGRIVNNAITGKVEIGRGISTVYWRPYVSVRPDGSSVHVAWTTGGMGNKLMHSWKDSGGWHIETVFTAPLTQQVSQATCAADLNGQVHVMFVIWEQGKWSTIFYQRKLANGQWEAKQMFTPQTPEYKHPMLFADSKGGVHATWNLISGFDAYYCYVASGGKLSYSTMIKIPKKPDNNVNGYGDLYVDRNGVVHRSIGGHNNSNHLMCIDHSVKPVGGVFSVPTHASVGFLGQLANMDPVPAVVAGEDGRAVVAWGEVSASGANQVKASFYDPDTHSWSIYTIDPAAGISASPNGYRVAVTRTSTHIYGVWRGADGHIHLFTLPISGSSLSVSSPNGGESWQAGDTHNITWSQQDLSGTATLALYKGGTKAADIGSVNVTAGTYEWAIPRSTAAGTDYRVRITQGSTVDESNADFSIAEADSPSITLNPTSMKFGAETSGAKTGAQTVLLTDAKGGTLHWTATRSNTWITVSPDSGTGNDLLTIGIDPSKVGNSAGTYTGTVSIADSYAVNSPQEITVTMNVLASTAAPIGAFELPKNGITVKGTVSLSGWALDDLGVVNLEIRRTPVKTDPSGTIGLDGLVYVGDAGFVAGARPDLETLYANYPLSNRAAWGYMLNTYALPGAGNGKFILHAVAYDQEGNGVEVGTRAITAADKYNSKPFGLIDAPDWGETISGTYVNTAWMLTPRPKIIPTTGKTIWVWIDGVKRAHPVYKQPRPDIAALFPLLRNKSGPGGIYTLDRTKYADGLHTIKWVAKDSAGAVGNTGTSYFRVLNAAPGAGLASASAVTMKAAASETAAIGRLSDLAGIPQDYKTPMFRRTGFGAEESFEPAFPDDQGVVEAVVEVDGLVEVRLGGSGSVGYMVVGDELRSLPAGTTLDPVGGMFSWMPGPGFLGRYDLVFVSQAADGFPMKRRVAVRIVPAQPAE